LSCLAVDIDRFKAINDRLGPAGADRLLSAIAQRMGQTLREVDLAARSGGEEFAILLPQTGKEGALALAERIVVRVRNQPFSVDGANVEVTVSIGVAATTDVDSHVADDLVRAADSALVQAKERGRNRVVGFVAPASLPGV
jgi:diguanylate cyclase (GGDEF)-like protein